VLQSVISRAAGLLTPNKDTNITNPVAVGIRGEATPAGDDATRKVADLGAAAEEAAAKLRNVEAPATEPAAPVAHAAVGGHIRGPGTGTSDSIPAMLSDGEYVVKADAVKRMGVDKLDAINSGRAHFADGGVAHFAGGGAASSESQTTSHDDPNGHHHQITKTKNSDGRETTTDVESWDDEKGHHSVTHNSDSGEPDKSAGKLDYDPANRYIA